MTVLCTWGMVIREARIQLAGKFLYTLYSASRGLDENRHTSRDAFQLFSFAGETRMLMMPFAITHHITSKGKTR